MANLIDVKVPDIGDFTDIPVIEILVKVGDTVKKEDSLVSLESDKATMEVPAPEAGTVRGMRVKVGARVSKGAAICTLELAGGAAAQPLTPALSPPAQRERETTAVARSAGAGRPRAKDRGGGKEIPKSHMDIGLAIIIKGEQ